MKSFVAFRVVHALNQRDWEPKETMRLTGDAAEVLPTDPKALPTV
jgi:hypothetical protein